MSNAILKNSKGKRLIDMLKEQRKTRELALQQVREYFVGLSEKERESLENNFTDNTNLNLEDKEAFDDWLAEQKNLGNPYPAIRAKRQKQSLIDSVSLPS